MKLIIQVGVKNEGKTAFCKKYLKKNKVERCLILDYHNEYSEYEILHKGSPEYRKFISDDWRKGIYRIFSNQSLMEWKEEFDYILWGFKGGLLIFDDVGTIYETPPVSLAFCLLRNDVILNIHTYLWLVNPKIFQNVNFVNIYKTVDSAVMYKVFFRYYFRLFEEAEKKIKKNTYACVDMDNETVTIIKKEKR